MPRARRGKKPSTALFKSAQWIGWALGGLEREIVETRERLSALTEQAATLRAKVGTTARRGAVAVANEVSIASGRVRRRGRMSPEARKRISELMKKRWAEAKKKNKNRL
jgi:hypothetical protein